MKKLTNKIKFIFLVLFSLPNILFAAASFEDIVKKIVEYTQSSLIKSIATLIIIGVFIYMIKNHDRLKEIFVLCITIILGLFGIINASAIANWMFG